MFPPERASYTANLMRRDGVLTNDELSTAVDIGINRDLFQAYIGFVSEFNNNPKGIAIFLKTEWPKKGFKDQAQRLTWNARVHKSLKKRYG